MTQNLQTNNVIPHRLKDEPWNFSEVQETDWRSRRDKWFIKSYQWNFKHRVKDNSVKIKDR